MVHALIVTVTLRDASCVPAFVDQFDTLRAHVIASEPNTLTYELHRPEMGVDPAISGRQLIIIERYRRKEDLTEVHCTSEVYRTFGSWVSQNSALNKDVASPLIESIELRHYTEHAPPLPPTVPPPANAIEEHSAADQQGVLVFCGSRAGTSPTYAAHARELGGIVGRSGRPLVYGAGTVGIMGAVAEAARAAGGKVVSVIPSALAPREVAGDISKDDTYIVETMAERKGIMFAKSSWVIAMAGGIGTLDELLEVLTLTQLNAYKPRVGLLNTDNFYGPFIAMMEHLVQSSFIDRKTLEQIVVRSTPAELWDALSIAPEPEAAVPLVWSRVF